MRELEGLTVSRAMARDVIAVVMVRVIVSACKAAHAPAVPLA